MGGGVCAHIHVCTHVNCVVREQAEELVCHHLMRTPPHIHVITYITGTYANKTTPVPSILEMAELRSFGASNSFCHSLFS